MEFFDNLTYGAFALFSFVCMIVFVVGFHEYGHFITARVLGVKVLTYSIGMGKKVFTWKSKRSGVEYAISALPVGGYVKMLDESELKGEDHNYSEEELKMAFNRAPVWKRFLIVLNGPLFNFILAVMIFFFINLNGVTYPKAVVGSYQSDSWAEKSSNLQAGDLIISIDDKKVESWSDFILNFIDSVGKDNIIIKVERDGNLVSLKSDISTFILKREDKDILRRLGISTAHDNPTSTIRDVYTDSPALESGLQAGDTIVSIDSIKVNNFYDISKYVKNNPGKLVVVSVLREAGMINKNIQIGVKEIDGKSVGFIGISPKYSDFDSKYVVSKNLGVLDSLSTSYDHSIHLVDITFGILKKLITGDLSPKLISGPVTMADSAGISASYGIISFLSFCAIISINLMLMNLLPVPGLDGGYLAFYFVEILRGKEISQSSQQVVLKVGFLLIIILMVFAIGMDLLDFLK